MFYYYTLHYKLYIVNCNKIKSTKLRIQSSPASSGSKVVRAWK